MPCRNIKLQVVITNDPARSKLGFRVECNKVQRSLKVASFGPICQLKAKGMHARVSRQANLLDRNQVIQHAIRLIMLGLDAGVTGGV